MVSNQKIFLCTLAACLIGATAAQAQLNVGISLGQPGYVVEQPPVVYQEPQYPHYHDPRLRNRDRDARYWHDRHVNEHHDERHDNRAYRR